MASARLYASHLHFTPDKITMPAPHHLFFYRLPDAQ